MDCIGRRCSSSTGVGRLLGFCIVETTVSVGAVLSLDIFQNSLLTWFLVPITTTCLRTIFIIVGLVQCVRHGRGVEAFGVEPIVWSLPASSTILCVWYSVSFALIASPGNMYQLACFVWLVLANAGLCCVSISMLRWYDQQQRQQPRRVMPAALPTGDSLPALLGRTHRTVPVKLFEFNEDGQNPVCAICLSEPRCGEELAKLPCKHVFHAACIETWAERSCGGVLCPMRCDADGAFAEEESRCTESSSTDLTGVQPAESRRLRYELRQEALHRQFQHPQTGRQARRYGTPERRSAVSSRGLSRDGEPVSPQMLWMEDMSTQAQQI